MSIGHLDWRSNLGLWKRLFGDSAGTAKSKGSLSVVPGVLSAKEEVESFIASGSGDRDKLNWIIRRCKQEADGMSLLTLARRGIQPRWHALIKDLDTAIEQFPIKKDEFPVKKDDPPAGTRGTSDKSAFDLMGNVWGAEGKWANEWITVRWIGFR